MATGGQSQTAENRIFLFRLQILVIDGGLLVLRNILDQSLTSQCITLSACLKQEMATIKHLQSHGVITQVQYDVLFPAGGKVPTSSDLDITLIICLLRSLKCFGLNKKFDWRTTPAPTDVTLEADICRLKDFRNKISHISTTTAIQQKDFTAWWNDIEQILVRRSSSALNIQQAIAEFSTCPLDLEEERRIQKEIKKWKDYENDVDGLKREMTVVKENVTGVKKDLEDVKENVTDVKKDLDDVKENNIAVQKYHEDITQTVTKVKKDFKDVKANVMKSLEDVRENDTAVRRDIEDIKENVTDVKRDVDEIRRRQETELRRDLIKFYRKRCSSIPLSPLLEEIETPLAGFYVMPDTVTVKQKSLTCHEEEITPIKSLKDMFSTRSGDQQEIYLSADAGFGKTAFSKYLAMAWCQAHCHDENYACFKDDELKTLFDFKFLFLVLLRDCTSVCNIDDMIEQQITKKIPSSETLYDVLGREKCLIILDGLDEWTHPINSCGEVSEKIPHRYVRENCVILTTTRPWKLGVANLKTSQISKKVKLVQLSADSTRQLEKNAIRKMTGVHDNRVLNSQTRKLNEVIRDCRLEHMQVIPLLLMYIVCLWCNDIPIGNSKHEIYTNVIEFLLMRTSKKHPEVQPSRESFASEIPDYFKSHKFCKRFYSLITSLAELAYQTLFNEKRENTLVFDRTVAERYLNADDMELSLLSGILSESRSQTLINEIVKVSVSHKTVQEFFAAIFISFQSDAHKIVLEKCKNIQDILDMSKICEFISGMNADLMCEISNYFMSVINEDEETRDYRTRTGREDMYNTPLYNIQDMFMSCLKEMPERENIQLCLQDFFIDRRTEHSEQLQRLLKQNKNNIKSLYIYISGTSSKEGTSSKKDTSSKTGTSRSLREIIDLFSLTDLSHIQKLYYDSVKEKEAEINRILFPSLQSVTLLRGTWTNDEENLNENLARVQNLQYLYIGGFTLSHKLLETFYNFISGQKSIKEITLWWLYCKEHGGHDCYRLNLDLSQHSTLSKLYLRVLSGRLQLNISTPSLIHVSLLEINLDENSLLLSRDMLNIERVVLLGIEMSAVSLQNFIAVLQYLPKSVAVEMTAISPETEYGHLRENIRRSQSFHVIQDDKGTQFQFKTIKQSKE